MAIDFGGIGSAASDIFGGLGSFDTAKGYKAQAKGFERAGEISGINRELARQAADITAVQADRDIYQTLGSQQAAIGGSGLAATGSALDIIRDSARQASLTKSLLSRNAQIEDLAYEQEAISFAAQAAAAKANAKSSKKSGIGGLVKGAITIGAAIFSDDRLKEDVRLLYRRPDGLGIYSFRYNGQPTTFKGVLASEVEKVMPAAVSWVDGMRQVDYGMVGVTPEEIAA